MSCQRVSQGRNDGRDGTTWTGSIRCLRKKIPNFTQIPFSVEKGIDNKYMDMIVREPISDVTVDLGYDEAATRERIPVAAVSNGYAADLYRGRLQGYKLVQHHTMLDFVLEAATLDLERIKNLLFQLKFMGKSEFESLEATLYLSIYGARMYIEFCLPYDCSDYTLKVACRNSVDTKYALTINLSALPKCGGREIPFSGFHRFHNPEFECAKIVGFLHGAIKDFSQGSWLTAEADREKVIRIIDKSLTPDQQKVVKYTLSPGKRVSLLHFRQILAELFIAGKDIFQSGEHAEKLVDLTNELEQLANEADTQQQLWIPV